MFDSNTNVMNKYIMNIPTITIGTFGNVSDGKSEMIHSLTNTRTTRHSSEKKRNISNRTGYANLKIWENNLGEYESTNSTFLEYPYLAKNKIIVKDYKKIIKDYNKLRKKQLIPDFSDAFQAFRKDKIEENSKKLIDVKIKIDKSNLLSGVNDTKINKFYDNLCLLIDSINKEINDEKNKYNLKLHASFIDNPGHHELIKIMLSSINLINGIIVVVSAAEDINTKPQLIQHLQAAKLAGLENIIICFNKVDLVDKDTVLKRKRVLEKLLKEMEIVPKVIIPTCFTKKIGLQYLLKNIIKYFNFNYITSDENNDKLLGRISRSFDVNKAGNDYKKYIGGVIGCNLEYGCLKIGDRFQVRPGIISKDSNGKIIGCKPLESIVKSLETEGIKLNKIYPGGSVGIGTGIDPFYCKGDDNGGKLVGNKIGNIDCMSPVYFPVIEIKFNLIDGNNNWKPRENENLNLQIGTHGLLSKLKKIVSSKKKFTIAKFELFEPVCLDNQEKIIISKNFIDGLKILGLGYLKKGDIYLR